MPSKKGNHCILVDKRSNQQVGNHRVFGCTRCEEQMAVCEGRMGRGKAARDDEKREQRPGYRHGCR